MNLIQRVQTSGRLAAAIASTALVLGFSGPARAGTVTLDFESLVHLQSVTAYFASYGITVVGADPGSALFAANENFTYGGGVVNAPSGIMYVGQFGAHPDGTATGGGASPPPNSFTLNFSSALTSFGFTDSAILLPSINSPWTARAYSGLGGTGSLLASASYAPPPTHPSVSFTLSGAGILSVTFDQTPCLCAAFYSANLDNFVLTGPGIGVAVPVPASGALLALGLLGLGWSRPRQA